MTRLGIYVDLSNLYYCIGQRFENRKLSYAKYLEFVQGHLGELTVARAYGAQIGTEAEVFIARLQDLGFETHYKVPKQYESADKFKRKADWDVGMAVNIIEDVLADKIDRVILGSADGDMTPVVEWCTARGIVVIILACGISKDLKLTAREYFEIPESLLEGH